MGTQLIASSHLILQLSLSELAMTMETTGVPADRMHLILLGVTVSALTSFLNAHQFQEVQDPGTAYSFSSPANEVSAAT